MKRILVYGIMAVLTVVGCEQRAENQGNFAKTEEFFKEMGSTNAIVQTNTETEAQSTPTSEPTAVTQAPVQSTISELEITIHPTINDIQQALQNADLYHGNIDGIFGPKTKRAILDFQTQNALKTDGKVGPKTWSQLKFYLTKSTQAVNTPVVEAKEAANSD